ncbi:hypothetical protein K438DRAFT_1755686 [Mycena galopus ATCC 62051]|nr:hypothetical protein K438DRAFT_1755686 [Mycena galopus ATCC 62051]
MPRRLLKDDSSVWEFVVTARLAARNPIYERLFWCFRPLSVSKASLGRVCSRTSWRTRLSLEGQHINLARYYTSSRRLASKQQQQTRELTTRAHRSSLEAPASTSARMKDGYLLRNSKRRANNSAQSRLTKIQIPKHCERSCTSARRLGAPRQPGGDLQLGYAEERPEMSPLILRKFEEGDVEMVFILSLRSPRRSRCQWAHRQPQEQSQAQLALARVGRTGAAAGAKEQHQEGTMSISLGSAYVYVCPNRRVGCRAGSESRHFMEGTSQIFHGRLPPRAERPVFSDNRGLVVGAFHAMRRRKHGQAKGQEFFRALHARCRDRARGDREKPRTPSPLQFVDDEPDHDGHGEYWYPHRLARNTILVAAHDDHSAPNEAWGWKRRFLSGCAALSRACDAAHSKRREQQQAPKQTRAAPPASMERYIVKRKIGETHSRASIPQPRSRSQEMIRFGRCDLVVFTAAGWTYNRLLPLVLTHARESRAILQRAFGLNARSVAVLLHQRSSLTTVRTRLCLMTLPPPFPHRSHGAGWRAAMPAFVDGSAGGAAVTSHRNPSLLAAGQQAGREWSAAASGFPQCGQQQQHTSNDRQRRTTPVSRSAAEVSVDSFGSGSERLHLRHSLEWLLYTSFVWSANTQMSLLPMLGVGTGYVPHAESGVARDECGYQYDRTLLSDIDVGLARMEVLSQTLATRSSFLK